MDVVVTSRRWFEDVEMFPIKATDMIISIATPEYSSPRLYDPQLIGVPRLNLKFHDVTQLIESLGRMYAPINEDQAKQIVDFAVEYIPSSKRLVVHCDAGVSRSPGVAIGLARYFEFGNENELRDLYPHFNITVAKSIWAECQKRGM